MNTPQLIIASFIITALWDVILRWFAEDRFPHFPNPINVHKWDFVIALRPYFEKHTLLGAAAIAGVIGAVTQWIIVSIIKFPSLTISQILPFLIISFLVSGFIGFPMKLSGLFPILNDTYYKDLGPKRAFFTDAMSGIYVQVTLLALMIFRKHFMNKI